MLTFVSQFRWHFWRRVMKDSTSCIISQTMQSHYNTWANHWRDAEIPEEPCRRDCRAGSKVESTSSSPIGTDDTESHKQSHTSTRCLLQSVMPSTNTSLSTASPSCIQCLLLDCQALDRMIGFQRQSADFTERRDVDCLSLGLLRRRLVRLAIILFCNS